MDRVVMKDDNENMIGLEWRDDIGGMKFVRE